MTTRHPVIKPDTPSLSLTNTTFPLWQDINEEERLLEWEISPVPLVAHMTAFKEPYDKLWRTADDFHVKYERWYNGESICWLWIVGREIIFFIWLKLSLVADVDIFFYLLLPLHKLI